MRKESTFHVAGTVLAWLVAFAVLGSVERLLPPTAFLLYAWRQLSGTFLPLILSAC